VTYIVAQRRVVLLALVIGTGCTAKSNSAIDITGTVAYRGKPIPGGTVLLQPNSGRAIVAVIEQDGRYKTSVPSGSYRVGVVSSSGIPDDVDPWKSKVKLPQSSVPDKYGRPETSGMSVTVATDNTKVDISLQ
jgi:hypothetical protein